MMGRHCARHSCPFCGWHYTDMYEVAWPRRGDRDRVGYRVKCCGCEALGPIAASKPEAAKAWNGRPDRRDERGLIKPAVPIDIEELVRGIA